LTSGQAGFRLREPPAPWDSDHERLVVRPSR
jgi:hypothetical protein